MKCNVECDLRQSPNWDCDSKRGTRDRERLKMSQRVESGREGVQLRGAGGSSYVRRGWYQLARNVDVASGCVGFGSDCSSNCGCGCVSGFGPGSVSVCLRLQLRLRCRLRRTPALQGLHTEWHLRFHFLHLINSNFETNFCSAFNFAACQC